MRRILLIGAVLVAAVAVAPAASADYHPVIASGPHAYNNSDTATFGFGNGSSPPYSCSLDGQAYASCSSPKTYFNLGVGSHTFRVNGTYFNPNGGYCDIYFNCTGSYDPISDSWSWTIDRTAPTASITPYPTQFTLNDFVLTQWSGSDAGGSGLAQMQVVRQIAPYNGDFTTSGIEPYQGDSTGVYTTMGGGKTACAKVRAVDNAGNVGAWSPYRCIAQALDDRSLSRSTGWTQSAGDGYFRSTIVATKWFNKSLAKTGVRVARVGVLATRCPTCGQVTVKVGSTTLGTVNLYSATTKYKQWSLLPPFSFRTANVTLTTATSGKIVQIDGLGVSQR